MMRAIVQVFSGNLLSKLLGAVREVLTAACFGTGATAGAYRVAQTGTLVPVNFFTSDSLNAAFIPLYKRYLVESPDKAIVLLWEILGLFTLLSVAIGYGLAVLAPLWVETLAPGLGSVAMTTAVELLRVMALGVPFYLWSMIFIFQAMAHDDFVPMALRPSVQNLGMIAGVLLAYFTGHVSWLAWGFTASYMGLFGWSLYRAVVTRSLRWPEAWQRGELREVARAFWLTLRPLLLLPVMLQGNIVTERAVASMISLTAVAAIDYSRFVTETIILLLAMPIAYVGLSSWSVLGREALDRQLRRVTMLLLLVAVPGSLFLYDNAVSIVDVVYARGAFDAVSSTTTAAILQGAAIGLWAQVVGYVLIKALNAKMRNRQVLWIMAAALFGNVMTNLLLYRWLGAWTLGLGNAVYGLLLFLGTVWACGLAKSILRYLPILAVACCGYLLCGQWIPAPDHELSRLFCNALFAAIYWSIIVLVIPAFRQCIVDLIRQRQVRS
ncbi:virulence factor MviN [Salinicola corii]|uniref:Virulence factor MviN n=1 Tax=Salinicola corii TaxID=2606937 RepID=A0A640WBH2_9GAMM|nr:lipid II flippase MurJ [Salinicola corii]KAA0017904.1 virulence factor MviN [Salinicola corii]